MSLRVWLQSSISIESSESLQGSCSSASCSAPTTSAASKPISKRKSADADDLGVDDTKQVRLPACPRSKFGPKKRCFNAAWNQRWIGCNILSSLMQLYCFSCRNFSSKTGEDFQGMRCESTFTTDGYRNWKHATQMNRSFFKHSDSKEYLVCYSTWKDKIKRYEITSLVNTKAGERNRYYFSTLIDVVTLLATHQLAFRGKIDVFDSKDEREMDSFKVCLIILLKKTGVCLQPLKLSHGMQSTLVMICKTNLLLL